MKEERKSILSRLYIMYVLLLVFALAIVYKLFAIQFLEGDKWCVVDFKTDTDIESKLHEYSTQVGWYTYAMTEVTGLSTNGYLLGV